MAKLTKLFNKVSSIVLHFVAGFTIFYFWRPIALWYFNYKPILGVDFYNMASYVGFLSRNFTFRFNGWKYAWWTGVPLSLDYPTLHAYLIVPLLNFFSLPQAVQIYMLGSIFLFLFFSYLLFYELSQNRILGLILAVATSFSISVYGPLVWGGSLPYFATQALLPLTILLLVKYLKTKNKKYYLLSALSLGISFMGHPLVGLSYLIPITFLLLLTYPVPKEKFISLARLKRILLYFFVGVLAGYPQMGVHFGRFPVDVIRSVPSYFQTIFGRAFGVIDAPVPTLSGTEDPSGQALADIVSFNVNQFGRIVSETHQLFFILAGVSIFIFIISTLIRRKRKNSLKVIPYLLPSLWVIFYIWLLSRGVSVFHGGWYRVFWPVPIVLAMFTSFVWGDFWESLGERVTIFNKNKILKPVSIVLAGLIVLVASLPFFARYSSENFIKDIEKPGLRQQSSAFPDSLGVYTDTGEFSQLKNRLTPSWLDPNNTNYRFYDSDQRVNIWWSALYDMPLFKGYIEANPGDAAGNFYWTSIALTQSQGESALVESWGATEEEATNNALFLLDWQSLKYLEAEHEKSDSYNPLIETLKDAEIFANSEKVIIPGWVQLYLVPDGQPLIWHPEEEEYLTYYEVKDDLVSPIVHSTDASVVGVIGSDDAYRTLLRNLAAVNLNSKNIIPVRLGQMIDEVKLKTLDDMDALILYSYDYKNHDKAWGVIEAYVKAGGRVLIETGSDVKQTDSVSLTGKFPKELPPVFPFEMTKQDDIGNTWKLSGKGSKEIVGIDLKDFGPPELDGEAWLLSLPNNSQLREGTRVILESEGVPLILSRDFGEGTVIWSGMNLPYHTSVHKSLEEAKLIANLLEELVDTTAVSYKDTKFRRESANRVVLTGSDAKGVMLRENSYPGWSAVLKTNGQSKKLPIYRAGPVFYGFSYVRIPEDARGDFEVIYTYRGTFWDYFWHVVWIITLLLILDRVLLGSRVLVPIYIKVAKMLKSRVGSWWDKEEEY